MMDLSEKQTAFCHLSPENISVLSLQVGVPPASQSSHSLSKCPYARTPKLSSFSSSDFLYCSSEKLGCNFRVNRRLKLRDWAETGADEKPGPGPGATGKPGAGRGADEITGAGTEADEESGRGQGLTRNRGRG